MGLRAKFNLVLLCALAVGLTLAAALSYRITQRHARTEVLQNARIMMESALAIRGYTVREIAPLLRPQLEERFLPHTVPSFAAQTNFRTVQERFTDYSYKEAALNPTNPADRATDWEADIIQSFRKDAELKELIVERETPTGPVLTLARPLVVGDEGCLACHSTPSAAPASMIEIYGTANGFGWKLGETIGAQVVNVPMTLPLQKARDIFHLFMAGLVVVFAVVLVILNVLLHYVVIRPVVRISDMASRVSLGELDVPEYVRSGKDEIASLSASFNRMRRSLENAMRLLEA